MRCTIQLRVALAIVVLALPLAGCKRKPTGPEKTETVLQAPGPGPAVQKIIPAVDRTVLTNDLRQIGILYQDYLNQNNRPPTKADDLEKPGNKLHKMMAEGTYVVFWEVNPEALPDKPKTILAFYKDVPTKGGMVLMADCQTVVQIRPDEYQSAPKAAKK